MRLVLTKRVGAPPEETLERTKTDVRTCAFLSFKKGEQLRFAHQSFFEFFIAQYIILHRDHIEETLSVVGETNITKEVMFFLASYVRDNAHLQHWLRNTLRGNPDLTFLHRLGFSTGEFNFVSLGERVGISDVELVQVRVTGQRLRSSAIRNVAIERVEFESVTLDRLYCNDVRLEKVRMTKGTAHLICQHAWMSDFAASGTHLVLGGQQWVAENVALQDCSVRLSGRGLLTSWTVNDCTVFYEPEWEGRLDGQLKANRTVMAGKLGATWFHTSRARLSECLVVGYYLPREEFILFLREGSRAMTFDRCKGVVIVDYELADLPKDIQNIIVEKFGEQVVVCEAKIFLERGQIGGTERLQSRKHLRAITTSDWYKALNRFGGNTEVFEPIIRRLAEVAR
jgi:hypothetical protein